MSKTKPTAMSAKEERVWAYMLANREADVDTVADACDVGTDLVWNLINRIGSPNWRETAAVAVPDSNPKSVFGEQKPKISSTPTIAVREMGKVFELGAKKYGRFNWREHKVSSTVYYDAAWRHMAAWFEGEDIDLESGVSHLAHVMACMAILIDAQDKNSLNDNREEKNDAHNG